MRDSKPPEGRRRQKRVRSKRMASERTQKLQEEYAARSLDAERLISFVCLQLNTIVDNNYIALGFPVDGRVKSLQSIFEKLDRKNKDISSVIDFDDFAGIRVVVLFKRDIRLIDEFITSNFEVISLENTGSRLGDASFGYQSNHYVVALPNSWQSIPSLAGLGGMKLEIQVRTIAQHMWAAVSHKLQYKVEATVPFEVRRSINRASAILEMVDLEFDRVLLERDDYINSISLADGQSSALNVDLVKEIMTRMLPPENLRDTERYDRILIELEGLGIKSSGELEDIIKNHIDKSIEEDKKYSEDESLTEYRSEEAKANDVYFSHTGLMRNIMRYEFGDDKVDAVIFDG